MTEFVSRWLLAEPAENANQRTDRTDGNPVDEVGTAKTGNDGTDKTDKINSVSSVSATKRDLGRFFAPFRADWAVQRAPMAHGPAIAPAPVTDDGEGFVPLDEVIAASEAARRSLEEIEARLARLMAQAAGATALDQQVVADWTAVRMAKLAGRAAA